MLQSLYHQIQKTEQPTNKGNIERRKKLVYQKTNFFHWALNLTSLDLDRKLIQ